MYSLTWLKDKINNGDPVEFLFFWGHTRRPEQPIGAFCLSQWYESPFQVEGIAFPTAEHWMMAEKASQFEDEETWQKIIASVSPKVVKELGRLVKGFDANIWDSVKYDIVKTGNYHKFSQSMELADYLLSTGDAVLVEASPTDNIWGIGMAQDDPDIQDVNTWRGQNLLGFALMEVRDEIKALENKWQAAISEEPDNLVTVASFTYMNEVAVVRGQLEAAGIDCFIKGGYTNDMAPFSSAQFGGIKLMVGGRNLQKAKSILALHESTQLEEPPFIDRLTAKMPIVNMLPAELRRWMFYTIIVVCLLAYGYYLSMKRM